MPLAVFDSHQFQAFSYQEHLREFVKVAISDEDNLARQELPRYFKSVYVPDDNFMLIGGLERMTSQSSARSFAIDEKGRLSRLADMELGRQYFATVVDEPHNNLD